MDFSIVTEDDALGPIPCGTLREAIGFKHCLLAKLKMKSVILDREGFVVSELMQSLCIYESMFD